MRAVNVGVHQRFQPALLAKELAHLGVINIGAAGTFVIREAVSQSRLRTEILRRLPFEPEMVMCPGREVLDLLAADPYRDQRLEGVRRFVSVMSKRPKKLPRLPVLEPAGNQWEVRLIGVCGRFALCLWRRLGRSFVDSNAIVEKLFGVSATTRNWNTIVKIGDILRAA